GYPGEPGLQGPAGPQGPPGNGGIVVRDSMGKLVGPVIAPGTVILKIGGISLRVQVGKSGLSDRGGAFYHTSTDCSGPRYFLTAPDGLDADTSSDGTQVFFAGSPLQQITYRSLEYYNPTFQNAVQCNQTFPTMATAGALSAISFSNLHFTPPFHLEY